MLNLDKFIELMTLFILYITIFSQFDIILLYLSKTDRKKSFLSNIYWNNVSFCDDVTLNPTKDGGPLWPPKIENCHSEKRLTIR